MITTQFTLYLENKPGALFAVTRTLAAIGVNVEAISVAGSTDVGLCQIVTSDTELTRDTLRNEHISFTEQLVLVVQMRDEVGALAQSLERLAKRGVNVNYMYATSTPPGTRDRKCSLVISAPDLDAAAAAWDV